MNSKIHKIHRCIVTLIGATLLSVLVTSCDNSMTPNSAQVINIGLIAPLSGGSAASGQAIQRGMLLAIDEVNQAGGVLGRPLALVVRDVANDPPAGVAALRQLIDQHHIVAVFGGIFSPVMLAQLDLIHEQQIPLINTWGSVTAITRNNRDPNYAFRVSVSDEYADEFLGRYARDVIGVHQPALIADTSAWGDSNVQGLTRNLEALKMPITVVQRFAQGDTNLLGPVKAMMAAQADAVLMVANAPEGAAILRAMSTQNWKVPVISHWGISGGEFVLLAGVENAEGVLTLQTYSFLGTQSALGERVIENYHRRFQTRTAAEIRAPVGVAHGYDGVHLLALAIQQAASSDGPKVRAALENLGAYDGLVKRYDPAFTPERHDALIAADYLMAVWRNGQLLPAPQPRLPR